MKGAFAAMMGISAARISQLIAMGLPVEPDGRLDTQKCTAWCQERQIGRKQKRTGNLSEVKLWIEQEKLRKIRLENAEREGELVDRAEIKKLIFQLRKAERDSWMAWAMRVSPALAAELGVDAGRMFAAIDGAVRDHLHHLSVEPLGGPLAEH